MRREASAGNRVNVTESMSATMKTPRYLWTTISILCALCGLTLERVEAGPLLVVSEPHRPGSTHTSLKLEAAPGDYLIQILNDLGDQWTNERVVTVLPGQTADVRLPLDGIERLFVRAEQVVLTNEVLFLTMDRLFEPEIFSADAASPSILWNWSDGTTSSEYPVASKDFGFADAREQRLTASPSSPITHINIGFDGSDPTLSQRPSQGVATVTFPQPLTHLRSWTSSYNPITNALDFTGFVRLEVIEANRCENLRHLVVANLPSLQRLNVERCDLQELDLTGIPELAEVKCARNAFTNIVLGADTGPNIWYWGTWDNPQLTQRFQDVMTNFHSLRDFRSWDNNQDGALTFVSTQLTIVRAARNHYSFADLAGQTNLQIVRLQQNSLTNIVLDGSSALRQVDLADNRFPTAVLDSLLALLDSSAPDLLHLDLSRNADLPSATGYAHYTNLVNRGVAVFVDWPKTNDGLLNVTGGGDSITFVTSTRHPRLEIRTALGVPVNIIWHWGDGTIQTGALLGNHDFGVEGVRTNYVQVNPVEAVTYFGAPRDAPGQGIMAVYGPANFPNLNYLYLYTENLTELSLAGCAELRQLHLARTPVSEEVCDQWFIDLDQAVAGPVSNADFWYPVGRRTSASDAAHDSLIAKGYVMRPF